MQEGLTKFIVFIQLYIPSIFSYFVANRIGTPVYHVMSLS